MIEGCGGLVVTLPDPFGGTLRDGDHTRVADSEALMSLSVTALVYGAAIPHNALRQSSRFLVRRDGDK